MRDDRQIAPSRYYAIMTLTADLFWSFRSPYSYLCIGRYRALAASHDVAINLRPVANEDRDLVILVAAYLGNTRLIDNLHLNLDADV